MFIFVYHDFIAPCFDKFLPLPEGELHTAISRLASHLGFPLKKLLVVEGSKRSAHSNAYFYGFWKNKCIVIFDTLLQDGVMPQTTPPAGVEGEEGVGTGEEDKGEETSVGEKVMKESSGRKGQRGCTTEEVVAVLAHELGHWKLSHNLKNLIISQVGVGGGVASLPLPLPL